MCLNAARIDLPYVLHVIFVYHKSPNPQIQGDDKLQKLLHVNQRPERNRDLPQAGLVEQGTTSGRAVWLGKGG